MDYNAPHIGTLLKLGYCAEVVVEAEPETETELATEFELMLEVGTLAVGAGVDGGVSGSGGAVTGGGASVGPLSCASVSRGARANRTRENKERML